MAAILFGLPVFLLLKSRRQLGATTIICSAAMIGAALMVAVHAMNAATRKNASNFVVLSGDVVPAPGLAEFLESMLWSGFQGALAGLVFWLIARPALKSEPNEDRLAKPRPLARGLRPSLRTALLVVGLPVIAIVGWTLVLEPTVKVMTRIVGGDPKTKEHLDYLKVSFGEERREEFKTAMADFGKEHGFIVVATAPSAQSEAMIIGLGRQDGLNMLVMDFFTPSGSAAVQIFKIDALTVGQPEPNWVEVRDSLVRRMRNDHGFGVEISN